MRCALFPQEGLCRNNKPRKETVYWITMKRGIEEEEEEPFCGVQLNKDCIRAIMRWCESDDLMRWAGERNFLGVICAEMLRGRVAVMVEGSRRGCSDRLDLLVILDLNTGHRLRQVDFLSLWHVLNDGVNVSPARFLLPLVDPLT